MPRNSGSSNYQPQYIPSFQPTAAGGYANNSAQTQAHVHAQNLLAGRDRKPAKANEDAHMRRRQNEVDSLLRLTRRPEVVQSDKNKILYRLPKITSPQQVITGLRSKYDSKNLLDLRAKQIESFGDSFLSIKAKNFVYEEIDDAISMMAERQKKMTFGKKLSMTEREKNDYVFAPLDDSIKFLNDHFEKDGAPLRVEWRQTQERVDLTLKDLYFVYPNSKAQYEAGYRTWAGSHDAVSR